MDTIEILVVDDQKEMLVYTTQSAKKAISILENSHSMDLILCDLVMPEMDGMEFVNIVKKHHPAIPIIMVTGYGTLEVGIKALKGGVFDFLEKPFSSKKLLKTIEEALRQIAPSEQTQSNNGFGKLIGNSTAMQKIYSVIRKVSYGNANVLITGESGVGKELVARSIHKLSDRRSQPFIAINCGALPANLFESELFGHEKGSFTGAYNSKPGLIEVANTGTLFLDEICEMPLDLQVKMLRVLEDRKIRRVGGKDEKDVDVRILTATNRDTKIAVEKGVLRDDLFFRINTINIFIPPLRERQDDIFLLTQHFLQTLNLKYRRQIEDIDEQARELFSAYQWPGNVRELQNVIERAYYLADPPFITAKDLPSHLDSLDKTRPNEKWLNLSYKDAKNVAMEQFEKNYLSNHLEKNDWNISKTAEECGIDRRTIHRLINKFNLKNE